MSQCVYHLKRIRIDTETCRHYFDVRQNTKKRQIAFIICAMFKVEKAELFSKVAGAGVGMVDLIAFIVVDFQRTPTILMLET